MSLPAGTRLGHYLIVAPLGAGGMGEVYRATDTKLGRDVALKVLPADMARDPERLARFQREARAVAALNHPHIVTVHSVDEAQGVHFLTMELVEGQSLDQVIPERGLPAERIVEIASAIADALAAAHEKGIVHRDLKPANVMVTPEGRVKVLDFGLAKVAQGFSPAWGPGFSPASDIDATLTSAGRTAVGVVMGTPAYMSPEQVAGRPVDPRTDIFSLGVILYEMATGRRPFEGASSAELASAILRDAPRPLTEIRTDLPADVARIIRRCLEKNLHHRVQTARDVVNELRDLERQPLTATGASGAAGRVPDDVGSGAMRRDEGFRVAVLPFKYAGSNADLAALSEGLSEEIVTGLSRFSYLRVIARASTLGSVKEGVGAEDAGRAIGARYVMEGSLRQAGTKLRLAAQLVDATTGAHLWAETYERVFTPEAAFELQDDLVGRIVSTVADMHGVLPRSMSEAVRSRPPDQLSPYEAVLRSFGYFERVTAEELAAARSGLEMAVVKAPTYADAWAMLALLCAQEYGQGFNLQADALAHGAAAARRAVEVGPSNHLAHFSQAQVLFFQKEFTAFRNAASRAAALNPLDGNAIAFLGELLAYSGDVERGLALAERAKQLNPNHPGWYWYADVYHAYHEGDYRGALEYARKVNMPGHWGGHAMIAAACGQLGEREAAGKALRDLLALRPDFAATARQESEKWFDPEYVERLIDGIRKAGLDVGSGSRPARDVAAPAGSGEVRAEEGFWVAVLPFKTRGTDSALETLADGLSEEIVTGLSRFSYLRVIARGSTARHASEGSDVRVVGRELGARYVMEGTLRQAGQTLRVAVQLVDAATGAHLWAESYNRPFRPEAVFELQDDLAPRIVSTVADLNGVLPHTMSEALRHRDARALTPYEAMLRGFGYYERLTSEEHAEVRAALERAVEEAPDHADCWALLSMTYADEYKQGFNMQPEPLGRALAAARRAVAAAPSNHLAYHMLAQACFFRRELQAFRNAADRAVALNPMDACTTAFMGILMAYAGDWERGCALTEKAMQLNPHHPGWYRFAAFNNAFRRGDDRGALDVALKINLPSYFHTHSALAAVYGQLGEHEAASRALQDLLALRPDFANAAREELGRWLFAEPELLDRHVDGIRKAGLEIPEPAGTGQPARPHEPTAVESGAGTRKPMTARDAGVALAVLPFSDMSSAQDQQYLCEGMAEEIMNALVGVEGIRVASRTSAFRAQRDGGDLPAIARALSVGHVLEGSVRTSANRIRVTAQLTDMSSGYQIWSERFDRDVADIFAVQDEIAAGVVEAVKTMLAPGDRAVPARPQVGNLDAYRCYLKGRHLRHTKNDHAGALRAFEEAVALDPSHAPSWAGVAETVVLAAFYGLVPARAACATAREALATAVRLQGESAETLAAGGLAAYVERQWGASYTAFHRALDLRPDHVQALGPFGITLGTRGRHDESLVLLARAREVDPLAAFPYAATGVGLLLARRPEEALRFFDQGLTFEQENTLALWGSCMAQVALGRFEEGIRVAEQIAALTRRAPFFLGLLGWALATAGRTDEARGVLAELNARPPGAPAIVSEGWLLEALGDRDAAFDLFTRAEQEFQAFLYFTSLPPFDPVRDDPRFEALRRRLGLAASDS